MAKRKKKHRPQLRLAEPEQETRRLVYRYPGPPDGGIHTLVLAEQNGDEIMRYTGCERTFKHITRRDRRFYLGGYDAIGQAWVYFPEDAVA